MMSSGSIITGEFKQVYWVDVRREVFAVNPVLAEIIDELSPSKDFALFKGSYPFGSEIISKGVFQIFNKYASLVPLSHASIDRKWQEALSYNLFTNPVSLLLKNSAEIFFPLDHHTIPLYGLIRPGKVFSTWRVLSKNPQAPAFLWEMTAGARSMFMLPSISELKSHKRLCHELGIRSEMPKVLFDHWSVFKDIANHPRVDGNWRTDILFFSKKWFDCLSDSAWHRFRHYLLDSAWQGSEFWRNQFTWSLILSYIQKQNKIKPNPYIDDTVKHLLSIMIGAVPAFSPATTNVAGPVKAIQKVYLEKYRLKDYVPTIMQPTLFEGSKPVYYSLRYPTTIEFSPKANNLSTSISDLYDIQALLKKYKYYILNEPLNIDNTSICSAIQHVQLDFIHPKPGHYSDIKDLADISEKDNRFLFGGNAQNKKISRRSIFLTGCIRFYKSS